MYDLLKYYKKRFIKIYRVTIVKIKWDVQKEVLGIFLSEIYRSLRA